MPLVVGFFVVVGRNARNGGPGQLISNAPNDHSLHGEALGDGLTRFHGSGLRIESDLIAGCNAIGERRSRLT